MLDNPLVSAATPVTVTVVSAAGVQRVGTQADLRKRIGDGRFFWIDIVGGDQATRAAFIGELGLGEVDGAWAQRFGQAGRMTVGRESFRAVTWLSETFNRLTEVHLLGSQRFILTIWNGDARSLDEIREHFADRAEQLEKSRFHAAAIILQLLLGTLHHAISEIDERLQDLREQVKGSPDSTDFATLSGRLHKLQSVWSSVERYSSAVRAALIGIESVPGMDDRGAAELNDYADQLEDLEHRLHDRYQWGSDIVQDYATAIAQRQSQQINRLTLVSLIFLPITFLTGFFGMNFEWMTGFIGNETAFILLGLLLPASSVAITIFWLKRRGLI